MLTKEELLAELSRCVLEMEEEAVVDVAKQYAACGYEPLDGILHSLVDGMNKAAELYEQKEYFIPEILICSSAMYNGLDILMPLLVHHSVFKKGIGRLPKSSHYYTLPPNCFIFIITGFCSNCITSRGSTVKQMY